MNRTYTTRDEAVQREIVEPINAAFAAATDYDVDGIADIVLDDWSGGYALLVDTDEFWAVVDEHLAV